MTAYDSAYGEPGWMRLLRRLAATFRLGVFWRVEVRVYWIGLVFVPLIVLLMYTRVGFPFLEALLYAAVVTVLLNVVTWSHEMGHIVAGWRYRVFTPLITLGPMGGVAHMDSPAPHPRGEMIIAAAGPAVHLLWLAVFWPLKEIYAYGSVQPAGWFSDPVGQFIWFGFRVNLSLMIFNLLPFYPMDGGRILRAALTKRMHPNRATLIAARVGMGGAVAIAIWAFVMPRGWSGILLAIAITNFFACRRAVLAARHGAGPYAQEQRAPWEGDPEAWKLAEAGARPPSARKARKQETARARAAARRREEAEELDALLARVSQVGLGGLSRKERARLQHLSKRSDA